MARQRTSPLEDLIAIASKFPWWISALLVPISYLVLHSIATRPLMPDALTPGQMGDAVATGLVTTLCMFGQFILPFAFGLAAIISWVRSLKQRKLYETVKSRSDVAVLNEMTWEDFEVLVGEHFRRKGFQISREGGNGPDAELTWYCAGEGRNTWCSANNGRLLKLGSSRCVSSTG